MNKKPLSLYLGEIKELQSGDQLNLADIGATTVGGNVLTLINPSALGYLRVNADNTVTHRSYANVKVDLGLVIGADVQAYDADLTTIAGLTATTDNFIVSVGSAWASRTPAQVKTTLAIANTDISGLGTLSTLNTINNSNWSGTALGVTNGGNGLTTSALGDIRYGSGTNTLAALTGNTTTTKKFLSQTGDGTISAAPTWSTLAKGDVNLGNVDNTSDATKLAAIISTANTWSARQTIQLTTAQMRLAYDASNYVDFTTASNSQLTISANGGQPTILLGGFQSNTTPQASSWAIASSAAAGTTTQSQALFAGATTVGYRRLARGSSNSTIGVGNSYAGTIFGQESVTIAASGTHALFAQHVIKPLSITAGVGVVTNSATLYLEDAATGATNNYTLWSDAGLNRFDGNTSIGTTPSSSSFLVLGAGTTAISSLRMLSGVAPTSPVDGDIWYDGTNIKIRVGAATKTFTIT